MSRAPRRRALVLTLAVVISGGATASFVLASAGADSTLSYPDPVLVTCSGGSAGSASFMIMNGSGSPTVTITDFVTAGSCLTYGFSPSSGSIAGGSSMTFTAYAGPGASVASCTFNLYEADAPSTNTLTVNTSGCGAGSGSAVLMPTSIDFGNVEVNTAFARNFTSLQNQSFVTWNTMGFQVSGTGFEMGVPCGGGTQGCTVTPAMVAPGAFTQPPQVVCRPPTVGVPLSGTFTFSGSGSGMPPFTATASLTCTGSPALTGPDIYVSPTMLTRTALVGTSDVGMGPLRIENQGDQPLVASIAINGADASQWSLNPPCMPCTIAPGDAQDVTVTYSANAIGPQNVTLNVTSNDATSPSVQVTASGTGQGTVLVVPVPASKMIDFGQVPIGLTSDPPEPVVVRNDGNIPMAVNASFTAGGGTFDVTPTSHTVPPSLGQETFLVTCTAAAPGDIVVQGNLRIEVPASGESQDIALTCLPVSSQLTISPSSIDFGPVRIGRTVSAQFQITNTSNPPMPMTIGTPTFSVPATEYNLANFPIAGSLLNPGPSAAITFTLEYTPTDQVSDTVSLANLVTEEPTRAIAITGTGAIASGTIAPATLELGPLCAGDLASGSVTLTADGDAPFVAAMPAVDATEFTAQTAASSGTDLPAMMSQGASATIDVYALAIDGTLTGTLTWPTDLPTALPGVPVSVVGLAAGVAATPATLDFGAQPVGTPSAPRGIQVKACGGELYVATAEIVEDGAGAFTFEGTPRVAVDVTEIEPWSVTFTPPGDGTFTARLRITVDGDPDPIDLTLTGIGGDGIGTTNYYACGCDAPLDAGGALPGLIVIAVLIAPRRRRR